jgi:hypothetical protein
VDKAPATGRPSGFRFDAELDLAEMDDRGRPGPVWTGKGKAISRSNLIFRSRRMCYIGRTILMAVHLIDDKPVALIGTVQACDYDGDGQYKVDIDLIPMPDDPEIARWLTARG